MRSAVVPMPAAALGEDLVNPLFLIRLSIRRRVDSLACSTPNSMP